MHKENIPINLKIYFDFKKEKEKLRRFLSMHLINNSDFKNKNEISESDFKFGNQENYNFFSLLLKSIKDIAYEDMMNEKPLNFSQNIKETSVLNVIKKVMKCDKIKTNILTIMKEIKTFEIKNENFLEIIDNLEFFKMLLEYKMENLQDTEEEIIYNKIILIASNFNKFLKEIIDKIFDEMNLCHLNFVALFFEIFLKVLFLNKNKTFYFHNVLFDFLLIVDSKKFIQNTYFSIRRATIFSQDSIQAMKQKLLSQVFGNLINIFFGAIILEKDEMHKNCLFAFRLNKIADFLYFTFRKRKSNNIRVKATKNKFKFLIKNILEKLFEIQDDYFLILAKNLALNSSLYCNLMKNLNDYEIVEIILEIINDDVFDIGMNLLQENYDFLEAFLNCLNILISEKKINKKKINEFLEVAFKRLQANTKVFSFNIKPLLFKLEFYLN